MQLGEVQIHTIYIYCYFVHCLNSIQYYWLQNIHLMMQIGKCGISPSFSCWHHGWSRCYFWTIWTLTFNKHYCYSTFTNAKCRKYNILFIKKLKMCFGQNTNTDIFLCIPDYRIPEVSPIPWFLPVLKTGFKIMHLQTCHQENLGLACFSASVSCKLQNMATLSVLKIRSSSS